LFLSAKQKINPENQFTFCLLTNTCVWVHDFTSDIGTLQLKILELQPTLEEFDTFNVGSIFEELFDFCELILLEERNLNHQKKRKIQQVMNLFTEQF
jgi:hypothetical protein